MKKKSASFSIDANYFQGSILLHNPGIAHLITNHPSGIILSYNRKTFGSKAWQQEYNYPDIGCSFVYQDMQNDVLGKHYGLYAHYNFYFFKRNMQFRVAQGFSFATNPYDKVSNFRNNAYGSDIQSSTCLLLNYHKENIFEGLGIKAGLTFIHYSNANVKAPNTSTNTLALSMGLVYNFNEEKEQVYTIDIEKDKITEPIRYNLALRAGINSSDVIGSGQYSFYIFSGYADKRLGRKSAIQLGTDVFFSNFLKEYVKYRAVSFPEGNIKGDEDYKRIGLFVGHELFVNKISIIAQLGYYVYYPIDFEGKVYNRVGLKYYFGTKVFATLTLKSHAAKAEAAEFGIGIRL